MESVWEQAQKAIKQSMDAACYRRWIRPLHYVEYKGGTFVLGCPNAFFKEWVDRHHRDMIQNTLMDISKETLRLSLTIQPGSKRQNASKGPQKLRQMNFSQISPSPLWESGLNCTYTFDRFVVGPCNEFAYSASLEVARAPETRFSPLVLLGGVGLGKSHLSNAIGNHIINHRHADRVCYITAEEFINEMVRSLKTKKIETFKDKYRRQCDVLVIDGVHFLSGKAQTQIELAYTLEVFQNTHKRVVLTSSIKPKDIPEMDEGLKSRLSSGLMVNLDPPDPVTRCRILKEKAKREGVEVSEEVTEYLAQKIAGNVRQLESALIHLIAKASLMGKPMDLELAEVTIKELFIESVPQEKPTIEYIQKGVCDYFKMDLDVMLSRCRKKSVYYPRQIAMYLSREHTDSTLAIIGKAFKRDHASVVHSLSVIQRKRKTDAQTKHQLDYLREQIIDGRQTQ